MNARTIPTVLFLTLGSLAFLPSQPLHAQKVASTDAPSPNGIPVYFYNGDMRVDQVLALDELYVVSDSPTADAGDAKAAARDAEVVTGRRGFSVRAASPAPDLAALDERAAPLGSEGTAANAVLYDSNAQMKRAHTEATAPRCVLTNRLSLKLKPSQSIEETAALYGLEVSEKVAYSADTYILEAPQGLTAGLDAANAIYESGVVEFATPLILRTHQLRFAPNDPMFGDQWHLDNDGPPPNGAVAGNDVNIVDAWDTATGAGINLAIIDDGLEETHQDLTGNARTDLSHDYYSGDPDPTPGSGDDHGTAVAGVAAADGHNGIGVTGAAFDANLVGIRLVSGLTSDSQDAAALSHSLTPASAADRIHIYSNSWGPFDDGTTVETFGPLAKAAIESGIASGRGGLGAIYVWAAGNGREIGDDANFDGWASSRYTIGVGATGAEGTYSYYSEPGASMLINTSSNYYVSSLVNGGITTTDRTGSVGYSTSSYTDSFGGTSSSCPLAAGIVALMLEANPGLTWRDVQHILVNTATRNDAANGEWMQNGGGRWFNHAYGFGRIDAHAAVNAAAAWTTVPANATPITTSESPGTTIPDANATGITRSLSVSGPGSFVIEHVEVTVDISHTYRGDLTMELTAPSGMVSQLCPARLGDGGDNYNNWMFTSVAHWGETPSGAWSLKVVDTAAADVGTLNSWTLRIHGYEVVAGPILTVTPSTRTGSSAAGTTTFAVANSGTGTMSWGAEAVGAPSWLRITSGSSGVNAGSIGVEYDENFSISSRSATIRVTAPGAANSPRDVTVTQDGVPAPALSVSPSIRPVSYTSGSTTFSISNTGTGSLNWTAVPDAAWLTVQPPVSGTGDATITVNCSENPLPTSRWATVTVTATGAVGSPQSVTVSQSGNTTLALSVTPSVQPVGAAAGTTSFAVANTGGGTMNWTASVTGGGAWLSIVSGASGTNGGLISLQYTGNATGSARTGSILVTAPGATGSPKQVTVEQGCATTVAPLGVSASDGAYSDRVVIAWQAVSGASTYRVYRSTQNSFASAAPLGYWPSTTFDDYSAGVPTTTTSSDGCGGSASSVYTTYYYWVTAVTDCGESAPSASDAGVAGNAKQAASVFPFRDATGTGVGALILIGGLSALLSLPRRRTQSPQSADRSRED
ncbi:MAG: S8 family serine peptidase [bacterium]|nr:S8 family serine peptidase [bacterium]